MLAFIPFFQTTPFVLKPGVIEIHVFGILVGIGVVLGSWLAQRRAERTGLSSRAIGDLGLWVVILGFIFAHQVSLFAYYPERVFGQPCTTAAECYIQSVQHQCMPNGRCDNGSWLEVFKIASGISSFGGFLGAAIGLVTFFRLRRIVVIPRLFELVGGKGRPVLRYLDSLAYGFSVGWFFGRMGCFTAHDHVGKPSSAWLAVNFPDGWRAGVPAVPGFGAEGFTPRFDLGFLEMLWAGAMFLFFHFWALKQKDLRPGWYAAVFIIAYAPIRFYLDTLRAIDIEGADKRYFSDLVQPGITPGQIGAVIVLLLGLAIWVAGGRRRHDEAYRSHTETDDVTESLRA